MTIMVEVKSIEKVITIAGKRGMSPGQFISKIIADAIENDSKDSEKTI